MDLEQLKEVFYSAIERSPEKRTPFLVEACGGDEDLRAEAMRLLAEHDHSAGFLETPFSSVLYIRYLAHPENTLATNQIIAGRYRIVSLLGEGGMGVVYKAEDARLPRFVALKSLGRAVAEDAASLERLRREAQAASTLNHPNICTIHDVVESEGQTFIVMEYLEGQTLKEMIRSGSFNVKGNPERSAPVLALERTVRIATQIIEGLEAANDKGIVHRDIKPANIFVTRAGLVKILDFGIAKTAHAFEGVADCTEAVQPPLKFEGHLTTTGVAAGTIGYMSPEQAGAKELDARTDLFSFGAVLYEMATGMMPFKGDSTKLVLDSIVNQEAIPAGRLNPDVPTKLEEIIGKCLQKDRDLRYQSALDVRTDLQQLKLELDLRGTAADASASHSRKGRLESVDGSPSTGGNAVSRDLSAVSTVVPPVAPPVSTPSAAQRATWGSSRARLFRGKGNPKGNQRFSSVKTILLIAALAATLAVAAYVLTRSLKFPEQPKFGRVEGSTLVIMNAEGKELWRKAFPEGIGSAWYHAQGLESRIVFGDLNGKGHTSVLYSYLPAELSQPHSSTLICYSDRGKEMWRWTAGRQIPELGGELPTFKTSAIRVLKKTETSPPRIVVVSNHDPLWGGPSQVAILDANGKTISEYWHSGGLRDMEVADLDGNAREEIIATGNAHGYDRQATLVVLEPDRVVGASKELEQSEFQIHGMGEARERLRLLFPRSDLNRASFRANHAIEPTFQHGNLRVTVQECLAPIGCPIEYEFDKKFHLLAVYPGNDEFRSAHDRFYQNGKDGHTLSAEELAALLQVRCLIGCKSEFVPVAQTYNAAAAFGKGWNRQSNPNGVWSYGYSSGFSSPITLYEKTVRNGINGQNAKYWLSASVDSGTSPSAEFNDGPAYNDGNVDFLANEFLLVAGIRGQYSNLIFTAPTAGEYSIVGSFRGAQYSVGTAVGIVAEGELVFSSHVTSLGQLVPFDIERRLQAGSKVVFSVGPGGGSQNTGLSVTITKPCRAADKPTLTPAGEVSCSSPQGRAGNLIKPGGTGMP